MKFVYYFDSARPENEKLVIKSIYGNEVVFISDKPGLVLQMFEKGDFLICSSVDELLPIAVLTYPGALEEEYMRIFNQGVDLVFDKSAQCNSMFIKTLITNTQDFESVLRKCIANYLTQKKITDRYARQHVLTAQAHGKKVGIKKGTKLTTAKFSIMKIQIQTLSKDFNGSMNDEELIKKLGISRNTFYKYKKILREEGNGIHRSERIAETAKK